MDKYVSTTKKYFTETDLTELAETIEGNKYENLAAAIAAFTLTVVSTKISTGVLGVMLAAAGIDSGLETIFATFDMEDCKTKMRAAINSMMSNDGAGYITVTFDNYERFSGSGNHWYPLAPIIKSIRYTSGM